MIDTSRARDFADWTSTMLERFKRWWALRKYRKQLPRLLVERYGRQRRYTPAQVLTTIQRYQLNREYAPYACAMFCSKNAYSEFASRSESLTTFTPLWDGALPHEWPSYESVSIEGAGTGDFDGGSSDGALDLGSFDAGSGDTSDTGSGGGEGGAPP